MRIISDFHDYYDCVQKTGQDLELIYLRKPNEILVDTFPFPVFPGTYFDFLSCRLHNSIIGFCGKIYPVFSFIDLDTKTTRCHTIQELDAFVELYGNKKQVQAYWGAKRHKYYNYGIRNFTRSVFLLHFNNCQQKQNHYANLFSQYNSPIFVADCSRSSVRHTITFNASLKELDFVRMFDPYQAFQEISMFVGGLAAPQKTIPEVSDKDMRDAKGFDNWSFKKESVKKR